MRTPFVMRPNKPRPLSWAFTLVELLVVIAIVGVLASIVIVTVGRVRENARSAACQSNLRQIGAAFLLHAAENKGLLPIPHDTSAEKVWPFNTWMYALQPHLEQRRAGTTATNVQLCYDGVFRCPGKPEWDITKSDPYRISYGMSTFDAQNVGNASRSVARRLSTLLHPSITMLAMDRATFTADGAVANMPTYIINKNYIYRDAVGLWHGGRDNVLFVDGHVEALPKDGLNYYLMKTSNGALRPW